MNRTQNYDFTIIVPVYNEEDGLPVIEQRLKDFLPNCMMKACVLFVNDGSSDRSGSIISSICENNYDFFYIAFKRNAGLSAAIKAGFDYCCSEYCGYIDADLQTAPEDFNLLLEHISGCSMVTGVRADRQDTLSRKLQSKIANSFRRSMTGDDAIDTCCPLKVFRTEIARKFPMFKGMHRFFPALVLLQEGGCYRQVPVRHFPRTTGISKFNMWNRLAASTRDCFAYRWMKSRYINYEVSSSEV